jgi:hypothetical protein
MSKQLGKIEIVIRGDEASGPLKAFVRYFVEDSADTSMRSGLKEVEIESPDFSKVLHDAGDVGEFWRDEVDGLKDEEEV